MQPDMSNVSESSFTVETVFKQQTVLKVVNINTNGLNRADSALVDQSITLKKDKIAES